MRRPAILIFLVFTAILLATSAFSGGPAQPARPRADAPDLQQITAHSGMIFLGRVETVTPAGTDRIRMVFRVLDGIRGAKTGETIAVEEWRGLWVAGHDRYQPGQTLMLFLYPRSRLGLTSPVAGEAGRLEITPTQRVVLSPDRSDAMLPRSLRLQKGQAALDAMRGETAPYYEEFAKIVRELAGLQP